MFFLFLSPRRRKERIQRSLLALRSFPHILWPSYRAPPTKTPRPSWMSTCLGSSRPPAASRPLSSCTRLAPAPRRTGHMPVEANPAPGPSRPLLLCRVQTQGLSLWAWAPAGPCWAGRAPSTSTTTTYITTPVQSPRSRLNGRRPWGCRASALPPAAVSPARLTHAAAVWAERCVAPSRPRATWGEFEHDKTAQPSYYLLKISLSNAIAVWLY